MRPPLSLRSRIALAVTFAVIATWLALSAVAFRWTSADQLSRRGADAEAVAGEAVDAYRDAFERYPDATSPSGLKDVRPHRDGRFLVVVPIRDDGLIEWEAAFGATNIPLDQTTATLATLPAGCLPTEVKAQLRPQVGATYGLPTSCGDTPVAFDVQQINLPHPAYARYVGVVTWDPLATEEDAARAAGLLRAMAWAAAGCLAVALLLVLMTDLVKRPVARASEVAKRIAEGDRSARIPDPGDDEFGKMSLALNTVADSLSGALSEAELSAERQRRMVSDVAHELRTPTAALLASAVALEDPDTRTEASARVVPQLRRLSALTENLLELSRLDAGRAVVRVEDIDLADLAAEAVADAPGASVEGGPLRVGTDPMLVRGILDNLLVNAGRYGRPPVVVRVSAQGSDAVVSVTDAGDGVPDDQRGLVFDRFVRGDASRHGTGSGLGLAIAREHARLLGGDLTLDADGRTFRLTLTR